MPNILVTCNLFQKLLSENSTHWTVEWSVKTLLVVFYKIQ